MAMIGRGAAIAEVGAHRHELHGVIAFSAWLGVHAPLMTGVRNRIDAFVAWGWGPLRTRTGRLRRTRMDRSLRWAVHPAFRPCRPGRGCSSLSQQSAGMLIASFSAPTAPANTASPTRFTLAAPYSFSPVLDHPVQAPQLAAAAAQDDVASIRCWNSGSKRRDQLTQPLDDRRHDHLARLLQRLGHVELLRPALHRQRHHRLLVHVVDEAVLLLDLPRHVQGQLRLG